MSFIVQKSSGSAKVDLQPLLQVLSGPGSVSWAVAKCCFKPPFPSFPNPGKMKPNLRPSSSTPNDKTENLIKAQLYEREGRQREREEREDNILNHETSLIFPRIPHNSFSLLIFMRQQPARSCQHITFMFVGPPPSCPGEGAGSEGPSGGPALC